MQINAGDKFYISNHWWGRHSGKEKQCHEVLLVKPEWNRVLVLHEGDEDFEDPGTWVDIAYFMRLIETGTYEGMAGWSEENPPKPIPFALQDES